MKHGAMLWFTGDVTTFLGFEQDFVIEKKTWKENF